MPIIILASPEEIAFKANFLAQGNYSFFDWLKNLQSFAHEAGSSEDAEIIFGTVIDDSMEESIKVTVVATGLGGQERVMSRPPAVLKPAEKVNVNVESKQRYKEVEKIIEPIKETEIVQKSVVALDNEVQEEAFVAESAKEFEQEGFEESELMRNIKAAASNYEKEPAKSASERSLQVSREQSRAKSIAASV